MARRYDESIRVRTRPRPFEEDPAGESPERFVWRGRLYLVQEVLSSWRERRPWWDLAGKGPAPDGSASLLAHLAQGADRRCWRVRARCGAAGQVGIYELAVDGVFGRTFEQIVGGGGEGETRRTTGSGAERDWRLTAVGD